MTGHVDGIIIERTDRFLSLSLFGRVAKKRAISPSGLSPTRITRREIVFRRRRGTETSARALAGRPAFCTQQNDENLRGHVTEAAAVVRRRRVPQAFEGIGFRPVIHGDTRGRDAAAATSTSRISVRL